MPDWKLWRAMAEESFQSGLALKQQSARGAVNRFYYAAYQISTAYLLYRNQQPPQEREAWSHVETPMLFEECLRPLLPSRDKRRDLQRKLVSLYKVRCDADYVSDVEVTSRVVAQAHKDARYLLKVVQDILPGE